MYCRKQKMGKSQNHRRDTQEGWQHPVEWHQCFCRKALRKLEPGEWRKVFALYLYQWRRGGTLPQRQESGCEEERQGGGSPSDRDHGRGGCLEARS